MDVWWLALDTEYTSYLELKRRRVIAQGWPQVGDLSALVPLAGTPANSPEFDGKFRQLAASTYGPGARDFFRSTKMMRKFLGVRQGDLFVGIEGRRVKGICQLERSVRDTYRLDDVRKFNYAQTYGYPVDWIDWNPAILGRPPVAPAQSVLAIRGLRAERQLVMTAWSRYQGWKRTEKGGGSTSAKN